MAITQKITEFAVLTEAAAADVLPIVDDPTGGAATKKIVASGLNKNFIITAAEIAAGVTPTNLLFAPGNVLRYGADLTGVLPSSTAFQNAHDALPAGGGVIVVPSGDYLLTTTVTLTKPTTMIGEGSETKSSLGPSRLITNSTNFIITVGKDVQVNLGFVFDNILFEDSAVTPASAGGIEFLATQSAAHCQFNHCSFLNFHVGSGIKMNLVIIYKIDTCHFRKCLIGIESISSTGVVLATHFSNPSGAPLAGATGISHKTSNDLIVKNSYFDILATGVLLEDVTTALVTARFENCDGAIRCIDVDGCVFMGNHFQVCNNFHIKFEFDDASLPPTRNQIAFNMHVSSGLTEGEIVFDDTWERDIFIFEPTLAIMTMNRAGTTQSPFFVMRKNQRSAGVGTGFEAYSSTSTTDPTISPVRGKLDANWNTGGSGGSNVRVGSITNHVVRLIQNDINRAEIATDGKFLLQDALGVGNSAVNTNTIPAASDRSVELFDENGSSIGFVALHTSNW